MRPNNRIPLETLRRSLGRVAQDVERRGEEAFALVPMRLYRLLEKERGALVESTHQVREAFSDLSEGEVEQLVEEELKSTRSRAASSVDGAADR